MACSCNTGFVPIASVIICDLGNEYSTEDYSGEDDVQTTAVEDILLITDSPLQITTGNQMSRQLSANFCTYHISKLQQISLQAICGM